MNNRNQNNRVMLLCAIFSILIIITVIIALLVGRYTQISYNDLVLLLTGNEISEIKKNVILNLRVPRIVAALLVGISLAASGTAFQALFGNPIASPDILGVSQGSSFGAVMGILFGFNLFIIKGIAFLIGIIVVVLVYLFANRLSRGRDSTLYLLLVGMLFSSFFQALVSFVKFFADPDEKLPQITYWLLGSFGKVNTGDIIPLLFCTIVGIIPLLLVRWRLNLLVITNTEAESMGVDIKHLRTIVILCATLLTAASTSVTGGVSWFGLIVPHIARLLVGNDFKKILPVSIFIGGFLILSMDIVARTITLQELPISVLTSLFGAPMMGIILLREYKKRK